MKLSFKVSHVSSLFGFLETFLHNVDHLIHDLPNRIGIELYSNVIHDSPAIYVPITARENLSSDILVQKIDLLAHSQKIFLDLNDSFEIVLGLVRI